MIDPPHEEHKQLLNIELLKNIR